ncbi:MAG: hypothetical protein NC452_20315 [Eubacterium sp.]|nr:hypothetical protein [Eubacterium sp.]
MRVIENQQLWLDNVLSYRARVEKDSLAGMIRHICDSISVLDMKITDDVVVSVDEEINESNRTILGVEIIVPVDRPFESNCHYVFKPHFKLENAVLLKYCGKASELPKTRDELCEYAASRHYSPLTNVYFSIKQINESDVVADAYMGINGNLL